MKMKAKRTSAAILFLICLLTGCFNVTRKETPDLQPKANAGGTSLTARAAQEYCLALADEYIKEPDRYQDYANKGLVRGTVGGIAAIIVPPNAKTEHTPTYQEFVDQCVDKQGYEVIGWSMKSDSF